MRLSTVKSPTERKNRRHHFRQRAVIAVPSGLTLLNLFFGLFAIVTASRGDFFQAGLYVVLGGVADMLDGRVARATNTGSRFGAELDSLVDIVTFGVAPAMIMYFAVLNKQGWDWLLAFVYVACAAWRLAVFNVEQAGRAKKYFYGLPSPAAGLTLATYYWFSQTTLYTDTNMVNLPWHQMLRFVMFGLAVLMISRVQYPAFPVVGFKTPRQIMGLVVVIVACVSVFLIPKQFFFPACLGYVMYGLVKTVVLGLFNMRAGGTSPRYEDAGEDPNNMARDDFDLYEPTVAVASSPRLSVMADAPMSDLNAPDQAGRRRRKRPDGREGREGRRPDGERPRRDRVERTEREGRGERSERGERPEREGREQSERGERPERGERGERSERRPRPDRSGRSGRSDRSERGDRPDRQVQEQSEEIQTESGISEGLSPQEIRETREYPVAHEEIEVSESGESHEGSESHEAREPREGSEGREHREGRRRDGRRRSRRPRGDRNKGDRGERSEHSEQSSVQSDVSTPMTSSSSSTSSPSPAPVAPPQQPASPPPPPVPNFPPPPPVSQSGE